MDMKIEIKPELWHLIRQIEAAWKIDPKGIEEEIEAVLARHGTKHNKRLGLSADSSVTPERLAEIRAIYGFPASERAL